MISFKSPIGRSTLSVKTKSSTYKTTIENLPTLYLIEKVGSPSLLLRPLPDKYESIIPYYVHDALFIQYRDLFSLTTFSSCLHTLPISIPH